MLHQVFEFLTHLSFDCHVVGGFNRERWRGTLSNDIDLVVPRDAISLAKQLARMFKAAFIPLDIDRDMARVVRSGLTIDIASYTGDTLEADLWARDLSLNAIACPITFELLDLTVPFEKLPYLDPCGGLADLKAKVIRGNKKENFEADPLRLLRVFRFAAVLDFHIDAATSQWIKSLAPTISQPAAERILRELELILKTPRSSQAFVQLDRHGLLAVVIPEFNLLGLQSKKQVFATLQWLDSHLFDFGNALESHLIPHLITYLEELLTGGRSRLSALKLTALLHDLEAVTIYERLHLGRKEGDLISRLILNHQRFNDLANQAISSNKDLYHLYRDLGRDIRGLGILELAQKKAQSALLVAEKKKNDNKWRDGLSVDQHIFFVNHVIRIYLEQDNPIAHPPKLVDGKDVMNLLKISAGSLVGKILEAIHEQQAEGHIKTKSDAIVFIKSYIK